MSLEVRDHPVKGRCLIANRLIRAGEVVLDEDPLLIHVNPEHSQTTCANCLSPLGTAGMSVALEVML